MDLNIPVCSFVGLRKYLIGEDLMFLELKVKAKNVEVKKMGRLKKLSSLKLRSRQLSWEKEN